MVHVSQTYAHAKAEDGTVYYLGTQTLARLPRLRPGDRLVLTIDPQFKTEPGRSPRALGARPAMEER